MTHHPGPASPPALPRPGPRRLTAAGFTLIELTITLVVLGIAAGLALPALTGMLSREGEKTASRAIQGILGRARAEALLSGRDWRVDIDFAKGQCRAVQNEPTPPPAPDAGRTADASGGSTAGSPEKKAKAPDITAKLPTDTRPRLALTVNGAVNNPDTLSIVLRPEGLCQPAFIRLPGAGGGDLALTIDAVGCRVELLNTDLDEAQERFRKALGLLELPWADGTPVPRS